MGKVIEIIGREVPHALDESCFLALKDLITSGVLPASNS
jgi:hypothetical protein